MGGTDSMGIGDLLSGAWKTIAVSHGSQRAACRNSSFTIQPGLMRSSGEPLPTQVRTPTGSFIEVGSAELNAELSERFGSKVELMKLKHGIFDEAPISVISLSTIAGISREAGLDLDRRRFRANIFLETDRSEVFLEDEWVGSMLVFGDSDPRPAVSVTLRDLRCMMVNLDPETAAQDARVMKTVVRLNNNDAGVYATVVTSGTIRVGDRVSLTAEIKFTTKKRSFLSQI